MAAPRTFFVLDSVRFAFEVVAFVAIGVWGFNAFDAPLNWVVGIGAPILAVVIAALFISPRAVVRLDVYGRALVEILLLSAAGLALVNLGFQWWALAYVIAGASVGLVRGMLSISSNVTD